MRSPQLISFARLVPALRSTRGSTLAAALMLAAAVLPVAPARGTESLSPSQAERLGMVQAWRAQISVPDGVDSIIDQKLHVHTDNPRGVVEVVAGVAVTKPDSTAAAKSKPDAKSDSARDVRILSRIPHDLIDARGLPIGKAEAERRARQEVRVLKARGITATLREATDLRVRLYSLASDGTLESRDAESGELVWRVRVGNSRLVFGQLAVSDQFIGVCNGSNVIVIDAANGEVITTDRTRAVPLYGCLIAGDYLITPGINAMLEMFNLTDPDEFPLHEHASGAATALPTRSPDSTKTAWATDRGFVYVMEFDGTPTAQFRLNTDGTVNGPIAAASGDRFFFGSDGGLVYGIHATRTGEVLWSRPFGEPFYDRPVVAGNQLLIRSTYGNLISLDLETGASNWDRRVPNVDKVVTVVGNNAFVTRPDAGLLVVALDDGHTLVDLRELHLPALLPNLQTNRLYLVDSGGAVQCLRPIDSPLPVLNRAPPMADKTADEGEQADAPETDGKNPFGAVDMAPAGDVGDEGGVNPFEAANPFGETEMENPFGGESPF